MNRLEEIESLLKMLDLTHRVIAVKDAAAHEVVAAVDFLRHTAFKLSQEKQQLEKQALIAKNNETEVAVGEPQAIKGNA